MTKRKNKKIKNLAKIKVIGVGGAGGNAVSRMKSRHLEGIDLIAMNTDAQDLRQTKSDYKIQLGLQTANGFGVGTNPELGRIAAEESRDDIAKMVEGTDLVFITCGLGGGTGSGASPVIAEIAKQANALVLAIITKPFSFEGTNRERIATDSWIKLKDKVDAIITISNDRIFNIIEPTTPLTAAFLKIDEILFQAVQAISDLITYPGLINLDFSDVRSILEGAGPALLGIGKAKGKNRAVDSVKEAIASPLLDFSIDGARRVLFNISGHEDLALSEVNIVAQEITQSVDKNARLIFGAVFDNRLKKDEIKVTVIASDFDLTPNNLLLPIEQRVFIEKEYLVNSEPSEKSASETIFSQNIRILEEESVEDMRKQEILKKNNGGEKSIPIRITDNSVANDILDDQYDTPTFLRKNYPQKPYGKLNTDSLKLNSEQVSSKKRILSKKYRRKKR